MTTPQEAAQDRREMRMTMVMVTIAALFSLWGVSVGWKHLNLPGVEFRQAQTALSAYFIQQEHNFSLAYPTPVLGKPWSIPMEFPLYQWVVVWVSNLTGMPLTQAGRLIGVLCYYLTLPAIFMLLADWVERSSRRWLILAVLLGSPFYIFYSRAFLIETMVLMASVWFLLSYIRGVRTGRWAWLVAATLFGSVAGLVKVTTFMLYLMPAAGWTLFVIWKLMRSDGERKARRLFVLVGRAAAAVAVPFAVTLWWIKFADATKNLNPSARFLVSANMTGFNFGTSETRFSEKVWQGHWQIMSEVVSWLPLLIGCGFLWLFFLRNRGWQLAVCLACFLGVQVLFPELYAWHEYYYVANAVFLLVAIGLLLVAMLESRAPRWLVWVLITGTLAMQAGHYFKRFYWGQNALANAGNGLTQVLNRLTKPNDVVVLAGADWNSMFPYYAKRRMLMIRDEVEKNESALREAFDQLKGERVTAVVLPVRLENDSMLLKLIAEKFGVDPRPVMKWHDQRIFLPNDRWDDACDLLDQEFFYEVTLTSEGGIFENRFENKWYETKNLRRFQQIPLKYMSPRPVRFYLRYGLGLNVDGDTVRFGTHPLSQLIFDVPPGVRHFRTSLFISPDAYEKAPPGQATDGVELKLSLIAPDSPEQIIYSRYINPRDEPADRGTLPIGVDFEMPPQTELELSVTAGPAGKDNRDWAYLGRVEIK